MTDLVIPDGVTSIGDYAFYGCSRLTSVTIPASVTSVGGHAFGDCYNLVEVYNLSNLMITVGSAGNGYIGYYAKVIHTSLSEASNLVTATNGVVYYVNGDYYIAVNYVGSATEITLDERTTAIESYAFSFNGDLTSVTIPDNVIRIGDNAFKGCSNLTSVTIGNSVTSIGDSAFNGCSGLNSVTIPDNVTRIGSYAFSGCGNLVCVIFEDADGWYVSKSSSATSGTNLTLTDAAQNATYLTSTYKSYYWYKG